MTRSPTAVDVAAFTALGWESRAVLKGLGYARPEEVVGRDIAEFLAADDRGRVAAAMETDASAERFSTSHPNINPIDPQRIT